MKKLNAIKQLLGMRIVHDKLRNTIYILLNSNILNILLNYLESMGSVNSEHQWMSASTTLPLWAEVAAWCAATSGKKEKKEKKEKKNEILAKRKRHINNNTFVKHWFPLSFYCLVLQCNLVLFPEMSASQLFKSFYIYIYIL